MPQLEEWEIWAVASKVLEMHGEQVGEYLLERVQAMMDSADEDGLTHWMAIAACVKRLQEPGDHSRMH
ncbi:DUF6961 family protein [Sphingobium sp.]|uniref:DUF6961 family protein n=1 Tax=Sphingobium sp. TaxID=1912891 RepID=UPI0029C0B8E4|nr:hypothetical protein [Sphingobium sp.]